MSQRPARPGVLRQLWFQVLAGTVPGAAIGWVGVNLWGPSRGMAIAPGALDRDALALALAGPMAATPA